MFSKLLCTDVILNYTTNDILHCQLHVKKKRKVKTSEVAMDHSEVDII